MARKSNKTAHVLNLLAGHDAQNAQEEHSNTEEPVSAAPEQTAAAKSDNPSAPSSSEPAQTGSPSSTQNISVIDTTGEDPLAELLHQELSHAFGEEPREDKDKDKDKNKDKDENGKEADGQASAPKPPAEPIPAQETAQKPEAESPQKTTPVQDTLSQDAASAQQTSGQTAVPSQDAASAQPSSGQDAAQVSETQPASEPAPAQDSAHTPQPEPEPIPEPEPEPDHIYLNIMEEIVKDKIIYFMRQFDVCTCNRCKADTVALTMNGLLPKYIVTTPAAADPLISYYTSRLISDVTVEATKACMTVKDNPRH